jgi:V/A-type H+-transporting ATPase subunit A
MLELIDYFIQRAQALVAAGVDPDTLLTLPVVRRLQRMGEDIDNDSLEDFDSLTHALDDAMDALAPSMQDESGEQQVVGE